MATKKDTAEKAETKAEKKEPAKKVTKTTKPKEEAVEKPETFIPEDAPKAPAIIDDTDKILKSSDVVLPPEEPVGKQRIVVSHNKSFKEDENDDEKIEIISAEEVLKDLEYDFGTHKIKPYSGKTMTSHEMHQGKYGIIDDVTKEKKKK